MSVLTDWLAEEEEKKKRLGGQRPSRTPPRSPQNLVESSPYARMREIDPNKQVEEESSGSLGPIDFLASGAYHFANSAFMGLPDYGIAAANEGWTPYDLEETNGWGKVGGIIGEAAGFLIPIGYAGKLAALPFKALSKSSGKIMKSAAANAGTKSIGESVARAATRTTGTVRAKNFVPGVKDARMRVTKKEAQEALNEASEKSILKTMNRAVDEGSSRRGVFKRILLGKDKPKKWLHRTFSNTSEQSVQLQRQIERNVRAGLKKDFAGVKGMSDDMINTVANTFLKGLQEGKHINTAGAWVSHGLGAGTPGWLRARVAGYGGRFIDMMTSFGIYNTVDEILHRQLEDGYVPRSSGEIFKSTAMFAAVLPLIEAIPGGVSGAMTLKNYGNIAGILKKPKYSEMSKYELTTFYDYVKYKMPGRSVGSVDDSLMRIRNTSGTSDGVSRKELAAGLDEWYAGARKDFTKLFIGEEAKNFGYSLPRMIAGAMYFSGAVDEGSLIRGDLHQGFFGDEFMHHLKEDPTSVATHMLTGVFFTRNRKPLSKDVKGRFPHQVHYSEEYQGKLAMLREMGFNADVLEWYFSSFSNTDIRNSIYGRAYHDTKLGKEIVYIMDKAMAEAKSRSEKGKFDSELDVVEDKNLMEAYDIWSASKASIIISTPDSKSREIDRRDLLEGLNKSERQEFNRQIGELTTGVEKDGVFERIKDSNWNTIRSEVFDKTILDNHYQFFMDYLASVGRKFGPNEAEIVIENEGTDDARVINLPRVRPGTENDVGELRKYSFVAGKLVMEGKAKWAEGEETEINAESMTKEGKYDELAEMTRMFEDNYGRSIMGEDANIQIDFNNLDIVWNNAFRLKERDIMEKLVRVTGGDIEGMPEKYKYLYSTIRSIFGNTYARDWRVYAGDESLNGDEILRKGEEQSTGKEITQKKWADRSQEEKKDAENIMKVLKLVHELAQYTHLGSSANMTGTDSDRVAPISLSQGQALLGAMRQTGFIGGVVGLGELSTNFRRYLYERAVDRQKITREDFALLQHTLDSGIALEPRIVGKDVKIVIPTPEVVRDLLFQERGDENKKSIEKLVADYRNLIYNRLIGFHGLVEPSPTGVFYSGEIDIRTAAEGTNVKKMVNFTEFTEYIEKGVQLTGLKVAESRKQVEAVVERLKETEVWSSVDGIIKSMLDIDNIDNYENARDLLKSLTDNIMSRRGAFDKDEFRLLERLIGASTEHVDNLEQLKKITSEDELTDFGVKTLQPSKEKLGDVISALEEVLDTHGRWRNRDEMNKMLGDMILGYKGDMVLQSGVAYARLKQGLIKEIGKGKRGETLEEVLERFVAKGKFSDFRDVVLKQLTGAFDSLDKEQLEALNKQVEKEASSYLAGIREVQFTISPNTLARRYGDIFIDDKTKEFDENLKQDIRSAYNADIEAGGVENIRKVIDKMVNSVEEGKHSVSDFVIEELPKLLHTLISTEKKDMYRFDNTKGDLTEQVAHGSYGSQDKFFDWWNKAITDVNVNTGNPNIYFTRLSRSAIIDGYLRDVDSQKRFRVETFISELGINKELTPEAVNEANRKAGDNADIEAILEAAKRRGGKMRFITFTVDFGGHDILVDMNGLNDSKGDFKEKVNDWYKSKLKYLKEEKRYVNVEGKSYLGDEGVAGQFEKTFGELIERFEGKDNISDSDARDILRHMYYDSSNRTGHDALFQHRGDTDKMKKANAELFKYAITTQGENAGRLSSKLAETLLDISQSVAADNNIEIPSGRRQGLNEFIGALEDFKKDNFKFNVSVIADEKDGDIESLFGSKGLVETIYGDMAVKAFDKLLRKQGLDRAELAVVGIEAGEIFDANFKLEATTADVVEALMTPKLKLAIAETPKNKTEARRKRLAENLLKIIRSDRLANDIKNIILWRRQSLAELTKIEDGTSGIDGVTYLSKRAARILFGMNGFHIGDGFASVKPVISHSVNSFFDGGKVNETMIGKTNFVYDPRVAEHLNKKGIDIMMGKSAAKSFSGLISEMPLQEGMTAGNMFQRVVDAVDMDNNFKLPIGSIGVVYSARALHPSKVVPAAAIGMSYSDTQDYTGYMNLKNQIGQLAQDAVGLHDSKRVGIVNALVNQAKDSGYDLDVGGGGLAMELFKLGMDPSDPFIKREVIRIFSKARVSLLGASEKPGAGVSVLIPEFDVSLPVYSNVEGNRRQTKYGGKKIPHEMGTRAGLYSTVKGINFLYDGEEGQDIFLRGGEHIDPQTVKFRLSKEQKTDRTREADDLVAYLDKIVNNTPGMNWRDLRVADIYQLLTLRFVKDKDGNPLIQDFRSALEDSHLYLGDTEEGITRNVRDILQANFGAGQKFHTSKDLHYFTERVDELGLGIAIPGLRIPSQSYSDVVISRLEGVYAKSFGNVIGANMFDVFTKHQGDFDVDKMFFYLDAPKSLMHKGIRNAGYNIEPRFSDKNLVSPVDLLNNNFDPGSPVSSVDKRDSAAARRKELVQNKYLIGRTNRLNYSLSMLRETGFKIDGHTDKHGMNNNFDKITVDGEAAQGILSQRVGDLASLIFDPHKRPHKVAFMTDHEILRWLVFGEWDADKGDRPDAGLPEIKRSLSEAQAKQDMFPWLYKNNIERGGFKIPISETHKEVMKDIYIESINVMGRAARVFSGIYDETGQRAPEHWEYHDIKDSISRFRKDPTGFLFNRLAWRYKDNADSKRALFDLFIRHNTRQYSDMKNVIDDANKGEFREGALDPNFITHDYTKSFSEKKFYDLTPALSVVHGLAPGDDSRTIYDHAEEAVARERYSLYSGAAKDVIDSYIAISAFTDISGEVGPDRMEKLWDRAQNKISVERGDSEIAKQQRRDILWQVLEKEMRSQDGYLNYLKGNKNSNTNDIELVTGRIRRLQKILSHVKYQSLHSEASRENVLLEEHEGKWANVLIKTGGKRGQWYENSFRHDVVVYEVDIGVETDLRNVEYDMLRGGQRLKGSFGGRAPQKIWIGRNKKYVVLRNPIRNISTDNGAFLHGLSAFAASTTLTPESLRVPFNEKENEYIADQFFNDIDVVRSALKDYGSTLKENLIRNPNDKKMAFAVDGWKVNDLMRLLMSRYVDKLPAIERENRLIDIFELLTMVEPLHGAEARIPGLKDISIPVFIQNRSVFKSVTGFYLRQLGDEGQQIVKDYVERKASFYRAFTDRSGDLDLTEKGLQERLFKGDSRILPRHLSALSEQARVVNDILYQPLTKFSDFPIRMALNSEFGVRDEQLRRRPAIRRRLERPFGSNDTLIQMEIYANSVGTDPNTIFSSARTYGEYMADVLKCIKF
jgi:hypothetical protein